MEQNETNIVWQQKVAECLTIPDFTSKPRGMEVKEVISGHYEVPMPAYIDLKARKVNVPFMFAEAAWIISGSNRLAELTPYMKVYENFSDDGVFLKGAYGPKVVDQLGYVVDAIQNDNDTRQAVINIWRERPGASKDIPCTLSMQFLLREGILNMVVTMRSQDIVLGYTYDVFTFSMVAKAVKLLLNERGIACDLGTLHLNAGSMHIYERHYEEGKAWVLEEDRDPEISKAVLKYTNAKTYSDLIKQLQKGAETYGEAD